jgi:hypothetical protein
MHVAPGVSGRFNPPLTPYIPLSGRGTSPTQSDGRKGECNDLQDRRPCVGSLKEPLGIRRARATFEKLSESPAGSVVVDPKACLVETRGPLTLPLRFTPPLNNNKIAVTSRTLGTQQTSFFVAIFRLAMFPEASEHS